MKKIMLGNEAIARGIYESGAKVIASYPGTPSTEITEFAAKYDELYAEWAPNEKVAAEVAIGASFAGARSVTCMKHVGLNVAADPLYTVSYTGVNGGLVICVADDPGMHSSQNEQDSRNHAIGSKIPMLEPADSTECKEFMKAAFSLSEQFDTPVLMRLTTRVAHSQSAVETEDRIELQNKEYVKNPMKYVMMPAMARGRHVVVEQRTLKLKEYGNDCPFNKTEINDTSVGIITSGMCYNYAKEVLPNASFLKLGLVSPLPDGIIADFATKVDKLYVIEELDPVIENHVKALGIEVVGKELLPMCGEFSAEIIAKAFGMSVPERLSADEPIAPRPPVLCPGCPHRAVFYTLSKLGLFVSGDIGCYSLGALAPLQSIDAVVCMGASVGMAHGMEKAGDTRKKVAVIGDSTFVHSGITGIVDIAYNKGNSTVIILDNSITGMTGHQQNPTTGLTIKGDPTTSINLEALCRAVGIERVTVVDPFEVDKLETVIKEEVAADEPSVIIARRPCALLKTVKYEGTLCLQKDKCKNCKMCMKIGCPAISFKNDEITIDRTLCNNCGLCTKICKFGALTK